MNTALIEYANQLVLTYGVAYVISAARLLGFMQMFPLFSWVQMPQSLRSVMSFVLATPMAFALASQMEHYQGNSMQLMLLGIKEFALGAVLGLSLALPFFAAQAAGDTIDFYRGASQVNISDPVNAAETTISGTMFLLTSLAIFLVSGGMELLLGAVYKSYQVWPVLQLAPKTGVDSFMTLTAGVMVLLQLALLLAAPMIIILALADIFLVFATKSYKQLQIFELSNSFKNLLYMVFMPMYILFFWSNIEKNVFGAFVRVSEVLNSFFFVP